MNSINEIKDILDKLNEELETLRAENSELKLRLEKYESIAKNDTDSSNEANKNMTIKEMGLSTRPYTSLSRAGLKNVADIIALDGKSFIKIRTLGCKSAKEVVTRMKELGFDDWAEKISKECGYFKRQLK